MIRWTYLLPRLAALFFALAIAHFGIPPLLRWAMVRSLESTTGTDIAVADVWTSLTRGEVRIAGVTMARESSTATNVLQFDSAKFDLDLHALTHQRCVIDEAQIRGLKFNTARTATRSDFTPVEINAPGVSDAAERAQKHTQQWLQQVTAMLRCRVDDEFESIRLARQLAQRWPEDHRQLQKQSQQLRQSAEQLYQAFSELSSQSCMKTQLAKLHRRRSEMVQLRNEIDALRRRSAQLAHRFQLDRAGIETALQHDRDTLRDKLQLTQLDGKALSDFLLDGEVRNWWVQLKPWLGLVRWLTQSPEPNEIGSRGRLVQFDTDHGPGFLIRSAAIDGQLLLAGHHVDFVGQACDLTWPGCVDADRYDRPAQLKLVTSGPFTAQLYNRLDKVEGQLHHQLALRCDDLPLPARTWGSNDSLAVSVAPSMVQIQARLIATKSGVDGRLRITQRGIALALSSSDTSAQTMLEPLNQAAGTIEHIDTWVDLTGTLESPQWRLHSDLGSQLQQPLQLAAQQIVRQQIERLAAQADQRLRGELAGLQQQLAAQEMALQQQLNAATQILSDLAEPVASRIEPLQDLLQRF